MIQIYHKYTEWEDFQNGMFNTAFDNESLLITNAIKLLSDDVLFYQTAINVLNKWPISSDVNLSNNSSNRQSWVGQSACCYKYNVPEILTRKAWKLLPDKNKINANLIADKIIIIYESKYKKIHKNMGTPMLF
jgi:hypothetical protein